MIVGAALRRYVRAIVIGAAAAVAKDQWSIGSDQVLLHANDL